MKKSFVFAVALVSSVWAGAVHASLIHSISHNYGSDSNTHYAPNSAVNGSCDTLNSDYVTVSVPGSNKNCQRFYDVFNFQALDFDSIDSFSLTLEFSNTSSGNIWVDGFAKVFDLGWHLRPALSGSVDSNQSLQLNLTNSAIISQTFTFDSSLNIFNDILSNKTFSIWMAQLSSHSTNPNFNLYSAKLDIYGTAATANQVPAPATLALLAVGLLALRLRRR